jgi:hypothetical protein
MLDRYDGGNQDVMLVGEIENMEAPKQVVPTLVQFERLNESHSLLSNTLFFSPNSGFVFMGGVIKRKGIFAARFAAFGVDGMAPENVQGGVEVVDRVTCDCPNLKGGNSLTLARTTSARGFSSISEIGP